ncbi:MAG: hypothetical protein ACT4PP_05745 [Sporichthyaceae bacterium]
MRAAEEHRVAAALAQLVSQHGTAPFADPATLRAALGDLLGADAPALRREIKLLTDAAAEGIPAGLAAPASTVLPAGQSLGHSLTSRLVSIGMEPEAARFAVSAWSTSLGQAPLPPGPAQTVHYGGPAQTETYRQVAGQQPGWNQNTGWNQGPDQHAAWNQTPGPQAPWDPNSAWSAGTGQVAPPKPSRRKLIIGLAAAGVVLIAGVGVGVTTLGSGGGEEAFGTGKDGVAQLRALLPAVLELDGLTSSGTETLDQLKEDCGVAEPPVQASASYLFGPSPKGTAALVQADAYPSAEAAAAYLEEVRLKLADCEDYDNPQDNFPNAVTSVGLDEEFEGPGLRSFSGLQLGVSTSPDLRDDAAVYNAYRTVQVGNVVATLNVSYPDEAIPASTLADLNVWAAEVYERMQERVEA